MDRTVIDQVVNHYCIVCNDIDDLEFDHFPAKTFAKDGGGGNDWRKNIIYKQIIANHS